MLESTLATREHASEPAAHSCRSKCAQASILVVLVQSVLLSIVFLQQRLHPPAFGMNFRPGLRTSIERRLSSAGIEAGKLGLDIRTRVTLKRQLPLMIYAAVNRIRPENGRNAKKQKGNCVFHNAFKISKAGATISAPASARRNIFSCMILWGLLLSAGCSDQATQYAGIWKSSCDDYWGVQIKPGTSGRYAVTFCGLSGCLAPGEWLPDTLIVNDPVYEVISSSQIRIRHGEHQSLIYTRCSRHTDWTTNSLDVE